MPPQIPEDVVYVAAANADSEEGSADVFSYVQVLGGLPFDFDDDGTSETASSAYGTLLFCATEVSNLLQDPQSGHALRLDKDQCSLLALSKLVEGHFKVASGFLAIDTICRASTNQSGFVDLAIADSELANAVADHKSIFVAEKRRSGEPVDHHAAIL